MKQKPVIAIESKRTYSTHQLPNIVSSRTTTLTNSKSPIQPKKQIQQVNSIKSNITQQLSSPKSNDLKIEKLYQKIFEESNNYQKRTKSILVQSKSNNILYSTKKYRKVLFNELAQYKHQNGQISEDFLIY